MRGQLFVSAECRKPGERGFWKRHLITWRFFNFSQLEENQIRRVYAFYFG
jgi:hypothetical protein